MHYTKTVFIRSTNQTEQFKALRIGQWVTGLTLDSKSGLYRGQYLGMDNDNRPVINLRVDNAKRTVDWKEQFRSNRSLRTFAKIKA
jgi:putative SOS response-associated peptidase YedK